MFKSLIDFEIQIMAKLAIYYGDITPERLFVVFNIFDILLYITGAVRAIVIIYDAHNNSATFPFLSMGANFAVGILSLLGLVCMSTWSTVQIRRFLHNGTLLERSQEHFFIVKSCLCGLLIVSSVIFLPSAGKSFAYTLICLIINAFQITWAIQIYFYVKRTLDSQTLNEGYKAKEGLESLITE